MKVIPVHLTEEFVNDNTSRQRYREKEKEDYLISTQKIITAIPAITLAGMGMGKSTAVQSWELANVGIHVAKQLHNGIARPGKHKDCQFYNPVDMDAQKKMGTRLPIASAYRPFYIATDDDEAKESQIERGVIFYNRKEAEKFASQYQNLAEYQKSTYYKKPQIHSLMITEAELPKFEEELHAFLKTYNNSFVVQNTTFKRELTDNHFICSYATNDEGDAELIADNHSRLLVIDFPPEIGQKELSRYFPQTQAADIRLENKIEEKLETIDFDELEKEVTQAIEDIDSFIASDHDTSEIAFQFSDEKKAEEKIEAYLELASSPTKQLKKGTLFESKKSGDEKEKVAEKASNPEQNMTPTHK